MTNVKESGRGQFQTSWHYARWIEENHKKFQIYLRFVEIPNQDSRNTKEYC